MTTDEARRRRCDPDDTWVVNGEATVTKEGKLKILNGSGGVGRERWIRRIGDKGGRGSTPGTMLMKCGDDCQISDLTKTHGWNMYK